MENLIDDAQGIPLIKGLISQNEMLKDQLINASMVNELVKVLHSCTDSEGIMKTILLSFQDLVHFDRAILFSINGSDFCLKPQNWVGIDDETARKIIIPLGFEGGDITDAIFLNRHIYVEEPDPEEDVFHRELNSRSYIVVPFLKKPTRKCWELKNCVNKACANYGSVNPYCWSNANSCFGETNLSENARRRRCLICGAFKAEGIFWLDRKSGGKPITSDDISNLTNIITLAGLVIENFRMINALDATNHELSSANERLRRVNHDLEVAEAKIRLNLEQARSIQQKLLPQNISGSETGYEISTRYVAVNSVGGDYYDLFNIADGIYGVIVADVSGHGIASALIMSMAKILLKIYSKDEMSPQKTLERINNIFLTEIATEHFVTIFYAVFDVNQKTIRFTSAGHCPILFQNKKTGHCELLKADGLFLGVFPDMMLSEREMHYIPNEHRLILYTDGLTEAINSASDMYGLDRLLDISRQTVNLSPSESLEAVIEHQRDFCGSDEQEDDVTLVIIDFK